MFPSSNSCNPFPLTTHIMLGSSFTTGDKHPADLSLDDPSPPFWHFPAPFIDGDDDGLLTTYLSSQKQGQAEAQEQILLSSANNIAPPHSEINTASPIEEIKKVPTNRRRNGTKQGIRRKRAGKKDRHCKIYTAHGPRDRRMRLSLQIARKFFDLQDVLGFDKASKTIEWLFSKSTAAIKELTENLPGVKHSCSTGGRKSGSSNSESEVVSAAKDCEDDMGDQQGVTARDESMRSTATARYTKERKPRKASFNPVARESRDKARARARQRTREKMKMRWLEKSDKCPDEFNPNELERLQFSRPLETGENSPPSTQTNSCMKVVAEEEDQPHPNTVYLLQNQRDSVSIIEKFLGITRAEGSLSMFNHPSNIADSSGENSEDNCLVFSGNWGKNNERLQYSYCTMTNIKESTGNAQERNPNIIFMTDLSGQGQNYSPIFMTQGENPRSNLMVSSYGKIMNYNSDLMNPSNAHVGRSPTSILISTTDIGFNSLYQENLDVPNKYHNLY